MKSKLTPLQAQFVAMFTASPDDAVRGNGTRAFLAAGGKAKNDNVAAARASQLLRNLKVVHAIQAAHARAEHEALLRLKDWKHLSVAAQATIVQLQQGYMPTYEIPTEAGPIVKNDAATGRVMLDAAKYIVDRGFPPSLRLAWTDPKAELATVLGVDPADLP